MSVAPSESTAREAIREGRDAWIGAILSLALALRLGLLFLYPYARGFGDETHHYLNGVLISHFGTGLIGHWPPAYDAMLGATFKLFGPDPAAARALQVLLSVLTVWLVYRVAQIMAGRSAARIAGVIAALDPTLIAYTQFFLSETLYTAILTAAVFVLHCRSDGPGRRELVLSGLLFGLSALTRSLVLWFFPIWIVWEWARGRPQKAREAALVLCVAAAVVLPWTLRNAAKYGDFLMVDSTLGRTAYLSYSMTPDRSSPGRDLGYDRRHQERERPECDSSPVPGLEPLPPASELIELIPEEGRQIAIGDRRLERKLEIARQRAIVDLPAYQRCEIANAAAFATRNPAFVVRLVASNFYNFWGPNSFLLRAVHGDLYARGPLAASHYGIFKILVVASTVPIVIAALLALGRRPWPPLMEWIVLFIAFYSAIHMLSIGHSRYRLPIMVLLIATSATWFVRPAWPDGPRRTAVIAAAAGGYLLLSAHYIATILP